MTARHLFSFWLTPATLGILLGVPLGIAVAQNTLETAISMMLGWIFLPLTLAHGTLPPPDTSVTQVPYWLVLLVTYYYPLAALLTAFPFYLTQRYTGTKRPAWRSLGLLMIMIGIVSLITCLLSPSFTSNGTVFPGVLGVAWINVLVSVTLGWGLASLIPRL